MTTTIYTIGHSNQGIDDFIALLRLHDIQTLIDVRSRPRSRFPHFNQRALKDRLWEVAIEYIYLGEELGGHPDPSEFYAEGYVAYERVANTAGFRKEIRGMPERADETRVALMCAEENPTDCHRHPLLARILMEHGLRVLHVRKDGTLQDAAAIPSESLRSQLPLFETLGEDLSWRSPKRIRR